MICHNRHDHQPALRDAAHTGVNAVGRRDAVASAATHGRGVRPPAGGRALAAEREVDLHALLDLVDRGCPPHLAARIMGSRAVGIGADAHG